MKEKAICVTSGGLDSISMGLKMLKDGFDIIYLHIDLKQKAEIPEHRAVEVIAKKLGVPAIFIDCGWLGKLGGSSLTQKDIPIPKGMDSLEESTNIKKSEEGLWVPGRNVVLLACAAAVGEAKGAKYITWGANASETAYPDNTMEFADRFTAMLEYGCLKPLKCFAPLYDKDKVEILKWGYDNGYGWVYNHTWSCDDGKIDACGMCGCCCNRRFAFYVLEKKYPGKYPDGQKYVNPDYFKNVYLKDLKKKCTKDMWMYKYLELVD